MMKTESELEVADARRHLGDDRVLTFLRACRDYEDILACKLVNEGIDKGKSLDEIFYIGRDEYGYLLEVRKLQDNKFDITFGFAAGPTAGDSGTWKVQFNSEGQIIAMNLEEREIF